MSSVPRSRSNQSRLRRVGQGLLIAGGIAGGFYVVGSLLIEKLKEIQEKNNEERRSRDSLRRRFLQHQEDITFILSALLPSLQEDIINLSDFKQVTEGFTKMAGSSPSPGSLSSSGTLDRSPPLSAQQPLTDSIISTTSTSATDEGSTTSKTDAMTSSHVTVEHSTGTGPSDVGASWSSEFSNNQQSSEQSDVPPPQPQPQQPSLSKSQLWSKLKLLTITNILTIHYTMTLLFILTCIQLNILGRLSYIRSVKETSLHNRRRKEEETALASSTTLSSLLGGYFWKHQKTQEEVLAEVSERLLREEMEDSQLGGCDEETERVFLCFSWWLLNVGVKEIRATVEEAVGEVFKPVSLKKVLNQEELNMLFGEVRRRVEYPVGADGVPSRYSFLPRILPLTSTSEAHLLTTNNLPSPIPPTSLLRSLLNETNTHLSSTTFNDLFDLILTRNLDWTIEKLIPSAPLSPGDAKIVGEIVDGSVNGNGTGKRMVDVVVGINSWIKSQSLNSVSGEIVDGLGELQPIMSFSAEIYTAYDTIPQDVL